MNRRDFLRRTGGSIAGVALAAARPAGRTMAGEPAKPGRAKRPPIAGPLAAHPDNRRYFTDGSGRAVYLTGSHTWPNLVDMGTSDPPPPFDFTAYLDFLDRYDHNFVRLWTWELTQWDTRANGENARHTVRPLPFARTGPGAALDGKPKFDLARFEPEYFDRMRRRVMAARDRGIYVSVMLFEGWGMQFVADAWKAHPFHPSNNTSGIGGGIAKGVDIYTLADRPVTKVQEAYVRKVVDTVNDLDNVLYEISNENHPPSTPWQYHVIRLIHDYERTKPKRHPVGMTFQYKGGSNRTLFDSPADWVSPNPEGGYRDDPPAADGRKVILSDTDHLWGLGGNRGWVWKSFLRGMNPLFMDPYDGGVLGKKLDPQWEPVRKSLGATLRLASRLRLAAMTPQGKLASSGYCLAGNTGRGMEYLVYLPKGGEVSVDLSAGRGALSVRWITPEEGRVQSSSIRSSIAPKIEGGGRRTLTAPFPGDAALWLAPAG